MVIQSFLLGNKSFFLLTTVERMKKKNTATRVQSREMTRLFDSRSAMGRRFPVLKMLPMGPLERGQQEREGNK